ncbi:MAG TPA: hypothetical protein VFY93_08950 [Planctomycetota bacterium]|nr:hypothetical protein [Planctomycetota bacterium]
MILRSIGKALLGKATTFQIRASAVLGGALGFTADLQRAPALTIVLVVVLLVLNTNIWLATLAALGGSALNVLLLPVSFHAGRLLLDGPLQGLFAALINAPVTALCGFQYYAITGGLLLGLLFGWLLGALLTRLVRKTREAFLSLDAGSEKFRAIASKRRVRVASWLVLGATPSREAYEKLAKKRVGNPVRIWGAGLAAAIVVAVVLLTTFLAGPFLASKLRAGLERVNGATVDLKGAAIDLAGGSMSLDGLAMADANDLPTDLFRTIKVEANVSGEDLLRRRLRFDRIVVDLAQSGAKRDTPGRRTDTAPVPQEAPPGDTPPEEAYKTIDDYVREAEEWRDRLAQLQRWLEKFAGSDKPEKPEKLEERLRRQIREQGYAWTVAEHLVRGAPTLLISELRIERLEALQIGGKQLNIVGTNLSTHPSLSPGPPHLVVKSEDGSILFEVGSRETGRALAFDWKGVDGDAIGRALKASPVKGGKVDLSLKGRWEGAGAGGVDLKLDATLLGTTLALPGVKGEKRIDKLELPLAVRGTLDDPRVLFRDEDLTKALVAAGQKELASKLADEAKKRLGDDAKKALEGFLGGK